VAQLEEDLHVSGGVGKSKKPMRWSGSTPRWVWRVIVVRARHRLDFLPAQAFVS